MLEFPKAMKYAGFNSGANSSHSLTTSVQRKGLLLAKQHTCPVNIVFLTYSSVICDSYSLIHLYTHISVETRWLPHV